jgi:predicted PurR-regulated permease PerM
MDVRIPDSDAGSLVRRSLLLLTLGALAFLCVLVLRPFLAPILWAAILAYLTWPLYRTFRKPFRKFTSAAASLMTLLVVTIAIVPLFWLLMLIQQEVVDAYRSFTAYFSQGPLLPAVIRDVPWLGGWLQDELSRFSADPEALGREISAGLQRWSGELAALLGGVGRNVGKLLIAVVTLFFFYRDGDLLSSQTQRVAKRLFGDRLDRYVRGAGVMTRAVVQGLLVTALAQGLIAGIGYRIVGLEAPAVLGVLTGLLSTVPLVGTALIWAPLGVGLVVTGQTWQGLFLLAWGILLVHPIDNLLRPLFVSAVTRVPFLLVMIGALGGLAAFGLVGAVIGPILLGVASSIWREWATEEG